MVLLPIIRVQPDKLGHEIHQGDRTIESCYVVSIAVFNLGITKAFPKEVVYGWAIGDALPDKCGYECATLFPVNSVLDADPNKPTTLPLAGLHLLKEGEWSKICRGNYLWFYCDIIYADFMEERHSHGFCWRWAYTGMGVDWRADNTPAYNRKT